ncbi:MAG: MFS transporter [Sporolactobacillus sp.]|nr:MFS transporter [Sporolactobacillus sp.]
MSEEKFNAHELVLILGLFIGVFISGADSFIISPLLPAISRDLDATVGQVSLAVTIYALCYAIGSPFFGPLGDKVAKKKMLTIGLLVFLLGTLLCGIAWNIGSFYLFRALAGIGASIFFPNVWAYLGSYFSGSKLSKAMGYDMAGLSLSIAIGVPLGTSLAQLGDWHMAFWGSGAVALVALLIVAIAVPDSKNKAVAKLSYLKNYLHVFNTPNAGFALSITLTWMFAFYSVYTFLGTFIEHTYRFNTAETGYVFIVYGLGNFVASFFGGWMLKALGAKRSVISNGILSILMILGLAFYGNHLIVLIVALILLALAQGFGVTSLTTYIVNVVPSNRSTVMSLNSSFIYWGLTLGSFGGGLLFARIGFAGIGLFAAAGMLLAISITMTLKEVQSH